MSGVTEGVTEISAKNVVASWLETTKPTAFAVRWSGSPVQLQTQTLAAHVAYVQMNNEAHVVYKAEKSDWQQVPAEVVKAAAEAANIRH